MIGFLAPFHIARVFGGRVLVDETPDHVLSIIELLKTITEESRLLEVLDMCLPALQFIELYSQCIENATHASMIGKHHATDFVLRGNVGTLLGEGHLDGGWAPGDKVR